MKPGPTSQEIDGPQLLGSLRIIKMCIGRPSAQLDPGATADASTS